MAKVNSKTQVYNNVVEQVEELLSNSKVTKAFASQLMSIIEDNLKPKSGGGHAINPPKEIDGTMHYYCRFHERYEPQENMVMSAGKSKGYCKASISKWNKTNSLIKKLDSQAVDAMTNGDFDKAQELAKESKEYKDKLNSPSYYDFENDWLVFSGPKEEAKDA